MTGWLPDGTLEWGGWPVARTVAAALPRRRAVLTGVFGAVSVRRRAVFAGTLRAARLRPGTGWWLEAQFGDGTGTLELRWVGRDHIPGIVEGKSATVEGTVLDDHGHRVLVNPLYRFDHSSSS